MGRGGTPAELVVVNSAVEILPVMCKTSKQREHINMVFARRKSKPQGDEASLPEHWIQTFAQNTN